LLFLLGDTTDGVEALALQLSKRSGKKWTCCFIHGRASLLIGFLVMQSKELGHDAISYTSGGRQVGIKTDKTHTKARIITLPLMVAVSGKHSRWLMGVAGYQGIQF